MVNRLCTVLVLNVLAAGLGQPFAEDLSTLDTTLPVRGFAIGAPSPDRLADFVGFISNELVANHINTLVLRVDFNYAFRSHPELRDEDALSRKDIRKIVKACRKGGIRVIPQINLLGHQSWHIELTRLLEVYPQFDETPWIELPEK